MGIRRELTAGTIGGLAGGAIMAGFMTVARRQGMIDEPVPVTVERNLEEQAGIDEMTSAEQEEQIGMAGHFATSAALGAGYGLIHTVLALPALPAGPLYGLGIYAMNFGQIGPRLGAVAPPQAEQRSDVMREVMMHVVYGTVTALVANRLHSHNGKRKMKEFAEQQGERVRERLEQVS